MLFEILRVLVVLTIAVPFIYIIFDVVFDIIKRMASFYKTAAKPVLIKIRTRDRFHRG
ncbi:MAG: hypothetical protein ACE5IY_16745 [bacterium]